MRRGFEPTEGASSCAGKIGLREPGEHTSGPDLASRDNVDDSAPSDEAASL